MIAIVAVSICITEFWGEKGNLIEKYGLNRTKTASKI